MVRGMRRSLFVALLVRLLVGFAAAGLLWFWLPQWWVDAVVAVVVAAGVAWWCLRLFVRRIVPLEQAAQRAGDDADDAAQRLARSGETVSYTHLTLPTIYSV